MGNTSYYLRKASFKKIEKRLNEQYSLMTCYKDKKERIMKNNDIVVMLKNKYAAVFLLDEDKEEKYKNIKATFM